jgi:hypothetical protein
VWMDGQTDKQFGQNISLFLLEEAVLSERTETRLYVSGHLPPPTTTTNPLYASERVTGHGPNDCAFITGSKSQFAVTTSVNTSGTHNIPLRLNNQPWNLCHRSVLDSRCIQTVFVCLALCKLDGRNSSSHQVEVLWVVTQCSVVVRHHHFRGPMEAAWTSVTLVSYYSSTQGHNSE